MYSEKTLQYFREPARVGVLPEPATTTQVMNPICGDILRLSLRWEDDKVADSAFQVKGCTASIAAGAALAEWVIGRSAAELKRLDPVTVEGLLDGLPSESKHAAALAVDAVREILRTPLQGRK